LGTDIGTQLLSLFENPKIPIAVIETVIEPMVVLSSDPNGKNLFVEKQFKLQNFTKQLDEIDNDASLALGAKFVSNLATTEDLHKALDGIRNEDEESIAYFCHLVAVDKLIPDLIKANPIELVLNTMNKILAKSPVKAKPLMHCTNALTRIFRAYAESCKTFLDLKGLEVYNKCMKLKEITVSSAIFNSLARLVELGPQGVLDQIINSGLIESSNDFWSGLIKPTEELFKKVEKFGGKKFIDTSYASGNSKPDRREAFSSYKEIKALAKHGFTFLGIASSHNKDKFAKVNNDFLGASIKLMNSFSGDYHLQTGGVQLLSSLPMTDKTAAFCIEQGLIETLFKEKMSNPLWKKIGLYQSRLINAMVQTGKSTITKLIKADAAKVIVALIHFLDEKDLDQDGENSIPETDELEVKEREEIVGMSDGLIDTLIELPTIKKIRTNLDALNKTLTGVPKDDTVNKIRIELATLGCANRIEKFAIESSKQDLAYFSEQLGKKVAGLNDFNQKVNILGDISKVFNSWIYSTRNERGHQVFTEKTVGNLYFRFAGVSLDKCQSEKICTSVMSNLSNGLFERIEILQKAPEDVRPKLTRCGTVIGINPDTEEDKITDLTTQVTKMMKQFSNNQHIQTLGCQIIKYIAILSAKSRKQMNDNGVQKSILAILNDEQLPKEVHEKAIETLEELAKGEDSNLDAIAKQKGLSAIFKSLKTHNSDEALSTKAESTLKRLMERPEGKQDMKEDMNDKAKQLADLSSKGNLSKDELKKASEATNSICNYLMNDEMSDISTDNGGNMVGNLKAFWSYRKKEEIELQSTGKRSYEYKKDMTNLAKGAQRIIKNIKPGDQKAIDNFKNSMLLEEAIKTFKGDHEDPEIASAMLKVINQAVLHPNLKEYALEKCNQIDIVDALNASFKLHKDNFDLMNDLITLAVELCIKYTDVANRIDGKAIIKQLLENGQAFLKKGIEEPKSAANTRAVINCLKAFSRSDENLDIMKDNGGLDYFNKLKDDLVKVLTKKSTYNFANSFDRISKAKSEADPLFEEGKLKLVDQERAIAASLTSLFDKFEGKFGCLKDIYPGQLDLGLLNFDHPEPLHAHLRFVLKMLQSDDLKEKLPKKELMKAVIGLKNKHLQNKEVVATIDEILKFNDVKEMLDEAIAVYEGLVNGNLNEDTKKAALNKLNDIKNLIGLDDIKEGDVVSRVDRIMKPTNKLLGKFERDIPTLDGATEIINKIAEKGVVAQTKLVNQDSEDLLTKAIFVSPNTLINVEKAKGDSYLHALTKVMNEKIIDPIGKKKPELNLKTDEIITKKEIEKIPEDNKPKSKVWTSKENKEIVNSFNTLVNPTIPKPEPPKPKPLPQQPVAAPSQPAKVEKVVEAKKEVKQGVDRKFGWWVPKMTFVEVVAGGTTPSLADEVNLKNQHDGRRFVQDVKDTLDNDENLHHGHKHNQSLSLNDIKTKFDLQNFNQKTTSNQFGRNDAGNWKGDPTQNNFGRNGPGSWKGDPTQNDFGRNQPGNWKGDPTKFNDKTRTDSSGPIGFDKGSGKETAGPSKLPKGKDDGTGKGGKISYPKTYQLIPANRRTASGVDPRDFVGHPQSTFDPLTARPMNPKTGKPYPINSQGKPYDPATRHVLPGYFDQKTGQPIDIDTKKPFKTGYHPVTGAPLDPSGEAYKLNAEGYPVHPDTQELISSVKYDPATRKPLDPLTNEPLKIEKFDPFTGRVVDNATKVPFPIHPVYKKQFDPKTGKLFPGTYDPYDYRPFDPANKKKMNGGFEPETGRPINPKNGEPFPINEDGKPYNPATKKLLAGKFDPKSGKPIDPKTGQPVKHINFDQSTGIPINPETRKPYPIHNVTLQPYDPETNEMFAGTYDPQTLKLVHPESKQPFDIASFDEENGYPLDKDGNKLPYDDKEKNFVDQKGQKISVKYDPKAFRPFDLRTSKVHKPTNYDPDTGRPFDPKTGQLYPLDPETGKPFDPETGDEKPGQFDFKTGLPLDPETNQPIDFFRFDPETGIPLDPVTKQRASIDPKSFKVIDPLTQMTYPFSFDPESLCVFDPVSKESLASNFDINSGKPLNYKTDEPYPIDTKTKRPYDPQTGNILPGLYDSKDDVPLNLKNNYPGNRFLILTSSTMNETSWRTNKTIQKKIQDN
jgi:hypothetical protein